MPKHSKKIISMVVLTIFLASLFPMTTFASVVNVASNDVREYKFEFQTERGTSAGTTRTFNYVEDDKYAISITIEPENTAFYKDEKFPSDGSIKANVTWNNGITETIAVQESNLSFFNTDTAGTFTTKITLAGKTLDYTYTVGEIASINQLIYGVDKTSQEFRELMLLMPRVSYGEQESPEWEKGYVRINLTDGASLIRCIKDLNPTLVYEEPTLVAGSNPLILSINGTKWRPYISIFRNKDEYPKFKWDSQVPLIDNVYEIGEEYKEGNIIWVYNWYYQGFDLYVPEALRLSMLPDFDTSTPGEYSIPIYFADKADLMYNYTVTDPNHGGDDTDAMTVISTEKGIETLMGEAIDQYFNLKGQALRTGGLDSTGPNFGQDIKAAVMESLGIETGNFDFRIYRNGSSNSYKVYIFDLSGKDAGDIVEVTGFQYNNGNVSEPSAVQDVTIIKKTTEDASGISVDHLTINAEEFIW